MAVAMALVLYGDRMAITGGLVTFDLTLPS